MEIRYPDYYKKFRCLAGECPDTCCVGWEIAVDRKRRRLYRKAAGRKDRLGRLFRTGVKRGRLVSANGKCTFLDKDGLCSICSGMGEEAMCTACRRYPRHMEDYGSLREIVLLLSCPEAARLVLTGGSGEYLVREKAGRKADLRGIDGVLLLELLMVRETLWKIGADRRLSMDERLLMSLSLGHDLKRRGDQERAGTVCQLLNRYEKPEAAFYFRKKIKERGREKDGRFVFMADFMELLSELETVSPRWPGMLEECRKELYHSNGSRESYEREREAFLRENPVLSSHWERLFGYFIYSFFLTALYDKDPYGNIKLAVYCMFAVMELDFSWWRLSGKEGKGRRVSEEEWLKAQADLCHVFAREIENSSENRDFLRSRLNSGEFGIRRAAAMLT